MFLREADRYAGEKYIATQLARNERVAADWNLTLDQDEEMNRDFKFRGLPAGSLFVPGIFRDDPLLDGFIGKLSIRKDDEPETVQKRLDVYHAQTQPLIDYYSEQGILRTVDGTQDVGEVFQSIQEILNA